MRGKWLLFAGVAILLAAGAGAISEWHRARIMRPAPKAGPTAQPVAPTKVVSLPGKIRARNVVPIPCPIDGIVEEILVDVGQNVYQGQLLARIKSGRVESAREAAQADAERAQSRVTELTGEIVAARLEESQARATAARAREDYEAADEAYQRQQMLYREGATPRLVFERAEKDYNTAKAGYDSSDAVVHSADDRLNSLNRQLDLAKQDQDDKQQALEDAQTAVAAEELHSPLDGVVVERKGQPGQEVDRGLGDLFQIATDLQELQVLVDVPPDVMPRIRSGQPAGIFVAEAGSELPGSISAVLNGQIVVDFVSPSPAVHPGLTAQVRIKLT